VGKKNRYAPISLPSVPPPPLALNQLGERKLPCGPRPQTHRCDILSPENTFGGNKIVSLYDSRQKDWRYGFKLAKEVPVYQYRPTSSTATLQFRNVMQRTELHRNSAGTLPALAVNAKNTTRYYLLVERRRHAAGCRKHLRYRLFSRPLLSNE